MSLVLAAAPFALGGAMFAATGWQRGGSLPPVPVPAENPITEEKRLLGKVLFYEEQLSSDNTDSCATCHWHPAGGAEPRPARHPGFDAIFHTEDDIFGSAGVIAQNAAGDYETHPVFGLEPQVTRRAAPSVINAAFSPELFWDSRAGQEFVDPISGDTVSLSGAALETQSLGPPLDAGEMAFHGRAWPDVTGKLAHARPLALASNLPADLAQGVLDAQTYPELFRRAFGDAEITPVRIAQAIATYQRTLISDQAPWDAWNAGDNNAMTPAQVRGFDAFLQGTCAQCHVPTQFTNHLSRNIGLRPLEEDLGLGGFTGEPFDAGRFKTPGLRNNGLRTNFMHTGGIETLAEVVAFYVEGEKFPENIDPAVLDIALDAQQQADLTEFLAEGLTDPRVAQSLPPFDVPTLFFGPGAPGGNPAVIAGTGRPFASGVTPRVIAATPPLIGSDDFKLGLTDVPEGAMAVLHVSFAEPVGGEVAPDTVLGPFTASHPGGLAAVATAHWSIPNSPILDGRTVSFQWVVDDPAAPEPARSPIVRATLLCGFGDCATGCPPDLNRDLRVDFADVTTFLALFHQRDADADLAEPFGVFNFFDVANYLGSYNAGCP
jgi:cytochrome c peroxidase